MAGTASRLRRFDRRARQTPHCRTIGRRSRKGIEGSGRARADEFELSFALSAVHAAFIR